MNIKVVSVTQSEIEEIVIYCHSENESRMKELAARIFESDSFISGKKDGNTYKLNLKDMYYIEVIDDRLFIYGKEDVYESKLRLYEIEKICPKSYFRASKSMLINTDKLKHMKPSFSGKFEVSLLNGEKLLVSRKYVSELKRIMEV